MMKAAEKVVVLEGNPRGRQVVLIDDIIITGSTMIKVSTPSSPPPFTHSLQCAELLQSLGAVSINVYVTHANFTGDLLPLMPCHHLTPISSPCSAPLLPRFLSSSSSSFCSWG